MGDPPGVVHYLISMAEFSSHPDFPSGDFKCGAWVDFRIPLLQQPLWTVFPRNATCPMCKELYEWEVLKESENFQRWLKQGVQRIVDAGEHHGSEKENTKTDPPTKAA